MEAKVNSIKFNLQYRFESLLPTLLVKSEESQIEEDTLDSITEPMINSAITAVTNIMTNSPKSNQKSQKSVDNEKGNESSKIDSSIQNPSQVVFDAAILNRMQIIIDKLQWIKKLKSLYSKTSSRYFYNNIVKCSISKSRDDASERSLHKYFAKEYPRRIEVNYKKLEILEKETSKFIKANDSKSNQQEIGAPKQYFLFNILIDQ